MTWRTDWNVGWGILGLCPSRQESRPSHAHLWCALAPMRPRESLGSRARLNAADAAAAAPGRHTRQKITQYEAPAGTYHALSQERQVNDPYVLSPSAKTTSPCGRRPDRHHGISKPIPGL